MADPNVLEVAGVPLTPEGQRRVNEDQLSVVAADDEQRAARLSSDQRRILILRFGIGGDPSARDPAEGRLLSERAIGAAARTLGLGWGDP